MEDGYVLVVGSAGLDVKGRPNGEIVWGTPNLGRVRNTVGGVARNIAENLSRLEIDTVLLSAVGDDGPGQRVLKRCQDTGIDCSHVETIAGGRTGTYLALLHSDGELIVAVSDFEIINHIDSDYLLEHESLFADAKMIVIDATLSEAALETTFELAARYDVSVCADPTTPSLAKKLCPYISQLYLVAPNSTETMALCGLQDAAHDRDSAIDAARHLVSIGAKIAVVTLGEQGLAYAHSNGGGYIRARKTDVVDATGAGDAFSGAAIFGLLNEVPIDEAMRLGITAASLTLEKSDTVLENLSQELLYDELVV